MDILRHQSGEGLYLHGLDGLQLYQAMKPQIKALRPTLVYTVKVNLLSVYEAPLVGHTVEFTYISYDGVTSCFLNGSDPSIIAWVSGARWVYTKLVFPPVCAIITRSSPVIKSITSFAVLRQNGRRTEVTQGRRHLVETHDINAPFK